MTVIPNTDEILVLVQVIHSAHNVLTAANSLAERKLTVCSKLSTYWPICHCAVVDYDALTVYNNMLENVYRVCEMIYHVCSIV